MATKICKNGHHYKSGKCPYCPPFAPKKMHKTRLFGTTIRETAAIVKPADKRDKTAQHDRRIIFTRVTVSVAVLVVAAVFVATEEHRGTGIGLFGTIIGYWLK